MSGFDPHPEAKLQIYGGQIIEHKPGPLIAGGLIDSMFRQRLYEQLAGALTDCVRIEEGVYMRKYHMQVYVLTPDQLEKYVQRRADRLYPGRPDVRWAA